MGEQAPAEQRSCVVTTENAVADTATALPMETPLIMIVLGPAGRAAVCTVSLMKLFEESEGSKAIAPTMNVGVQVW